MFVDLLFLLEFLELVATLKARIDEVAALFEGEDPPSLVELPYEERVAMLKEATLLIRRLELNIACYPTGYTTVLLFDMDGNPIP